VIRRDFVKIMSGATRKINDKKPCDVLNNYMLLAMAPDHLSLKYFPM